MSKQSEILDKILKGEPQESARGRGEVVWVQDPRHPAGGYYVEVADCHDLSSKIDLRSDDLEKYLRS